jgi:preprotein translocase subunit SecE
MAGEKKDGSGKSGKSAAGATIEGVAEEVKKKKSVGPFEFLQQVRAEGEKVTWTTWNETWVSTLMVLVMVIIMAIFFLLVDQGLKFTICHVLPINCAAPTQ